MDALAIAYPVNAYVDFDPKMPHDLAFRISMVERVFGQYKNFKKGEVRKRIELVNELIAQYRHGGTKIFWLLFSQHKRRELCDESDLSDLYTFDKRDVKIPVGVTYQELSRAIYPNAEEVIKKIGKIKRLTLGGFHKEDCVSRFADAARNLGIETKIDALLTEEFFKAAVESLQQDMLQYSIDHGFLDPEMHEDDPQEEKRLIFDNRLNAFL